MLPHEDAKAGPQSRHGGSPCRAERGLYRDIQMLVSRVKAGLRQPSQSGPRPEGGHVAVATLGCDPWSASRTYREFIKEDRGPQSGANALCVDDLGAGAVGVHREHVGVLFRNELVEHDHRAVWGVVRAVVGLS